jgi:hypothetical protein
MEMENLTKEQEDYVLEQAREKFYDEKFDDKFCEEYDELD